MAALIGGVTFTFVSHVKLASLHYRIWDFVLLLFWESWYGAEVTACFRSSMLTFPRYLGFTIENPSQFFSFVMFQDCAVVSFLRWMSLDLLMHDKKRWECFKEAEHEPVLCPGSEGSCSSTILRAILIRLQPVPKEVIFPGQGLHQQGPGPGFTHMAGGRHSYDTGWAGTEGLRQS